MKNFIFSTLFLWLSFSAHARDKPNIIIFSFDDLRPLIGSYGESSVITPNLDQLATDSVQFERAYTTYSVCSLSRAAMLTGIRYKDKNASFNSLIRTQETWVNILKRNGYWTATRGKFYHGDVPSTELNAWNIPGPAWATRDKDSGPSVMNNLSRIGGRDIDVADFLMGEVKGGGSLIYGALNGPDTNLNDGKVARDVIGYIRNRNRNKPFLISAGFSRPHLPWLAPKRFHDMYRTRDSQLFPRSSDGELTSTTKKLASSRIRLDKGWNEGVTNRQAKELIRGYKASISFADAQMGKIINELKRQGLYENTVIIMWGDHGYHLTEHGIWRKQTSYDIANRMPLMIKAPGLRSNIKTQRIVQNTDIYPTVLALAGIRTPRNIALHGDSLVPLLAGRNFPREDIAYSALKDDIGVVTERFRFTLNESGDKFLFNLQNDPTETRNIANRPQHQALIGRLERKINRLVWDQAREDP